MTVRRRLRFGRPVIDAAAALLVAVFTATGSFGSSDFFGPSLAGLDADVPPPAFGLPAAALLAVLAWRRRARPAVFVAGALAVNAVVSAHLAIMVALYTYAVRHSAWPRVVPVVVAALVVVGVPIWRFAGADGALPVSVAFCVAPALFGLYVGTRRELVERIRERAERVEREQEQRIARARGEERAQIARDMHDVITHRVAVMVLHATALEATRGEDAARIAERIGATGREALAELRSLVAVLRGGDDAPLVPQPGLADIGALVEESRRLGAEVTLAMDDPPEPRAPMLVEHALYRVAQEALTNVHKHADAAATAVEVRFGSGAVRLSVVNGPGRHPVRGLPEGGHGMLGIAERVRLVGGCLTAGPTADGGFALVAEVPWGAGR